MSKLNPLTPLKQTLTNRLKPAVIRGKIPNLKSAPAIKNVRRRKMYAALRKSGSGLHHSNPRMRSL